MKRFLTVFFALMLLFTVACASESAEEESFDLAISGDTDEKTDLQGITYRVATTWVEELQPNYGDSSYGDNILQRYADAKKDLNFDIYIWNEPNEKGWIYKYIAAGSGIPDCMDAIGGVAVEWYRSNILVPMTDISTMDYTDAEKYGPFQFIQYGIFSDRQPYGFFSWSWEYLPQFAGTILFNSVHVRNGGIQNPYELQETGNWNWDGFRKELETCQNAFSSSETRIYPCVQDSAERIAKTAMFSNGLDLVVKSGSGYGSDIFSNDAYEAIEYVADLYSRDLMFSGGTSEFCYNQAAVFYFCESYQGTIFTAQNADSAPNNLEEFGMMPFPYGPKGTPETVSAYVWNGRRLFWTCSLSENDTEDIGIIYEYLFKPFRDDYIYGVGWKDVAKTNVFHHLQGLENFIYMTDHIRYDYSTQLEDATAEFSSKMTQAITGRISVSSAFSALTTIITEEINENITWVSDEIAW